MAVGTSFEITGRLMSGAEVVGYRLSSWGKETNAKKEVVCFLAGRGRINNAECILNVAEGEVTLSGLNGTKLASLPKIEIKAPEKNQVKATTKTQEKTQVKATTKATTKTQEKKAETKVDVKQHEDIENIKKVGDEIKEDLIKFAIEAYGGDGTICNNPRLLKISKIVANIIGDSTIKNRISSSEYKEIKECLTTLLAVTAQAIHIYSKYGAIKKLSSDTLDVIIIRNNGRYDSYFRIEMETIKGPHILQIFSYIREDKKDGFGAEIAAMSMANIKGEYLSHEDCAERFSQEGSDCLEMIEWFGLNDRVKRLAGIA